MTRVVEVPAQLDFEHFDSLAKSFGEPEEGEKLLFDAHGAQFASPYGLLGLLVAGQKANEKLGSKPIFTGLFPPVARRILGCECAIVRSHR